ncbi:MAG: type II toxin-antitoxin system VapC family toxin [Aeromicrobium sp.]
MKVFVDTSALLAILDEDDRYHREAAETFRALMVDTELVTHNYVEVETLTLARRRLGPGSVALLTDRLLPSLTTIWVDESLHRAALAAHRGAGTSVSLVDNVSFEVMRREGIDQAFAFDADFEAQGFRRPVIDDRVRQGRGLGEAATPYGTDVTEAAELVSVSEIASRARRPISTIQSWRRRHRDFPQPVASLAAGPVWRWPIVEGWIANRATRRQLAHRDFSELGAALPELRAARAVVERVDEAVAK